MDNKKYEEIGTNYRFFLSWRHAAFAGDLIILYGILTLTFSIYKASPSIAWAIPTIGSPVGVLLWIIDVRTRELYHAAITAGKKLEGKEGGFFTELAKIVVAKEKSAFSKLTQSAALNVLFLGSSILLAILAVTLYAMAN